MCINETLIESPIESNLMARLPWGLEEQCNVHYKTTCETNFEEKEVIEELMTTLKAVPNTNCKSESQEICVTSECPIVFSKKICEAKEISQVALLPKVTNISSLLLIFAKPNFLFDLGILPTCTQRNLH
jgi:hypothetical protein